MPTDPETPTLLQALIGAIGLGGAGLGWRMRQVEKRTDSHGERLDAVERAQGILLDRSERAVEDRKDIKDVLARIEGKLP